MSTSTTRATQAVLAYGPVIERASHSVRASDDPPPLDIACRDPSRWKNIERRHLPPRGSTFVFGECGGFSERRQRDCARQVLGEKFMKAHAIPSRRITQRRHLFPFGVKIGLQRATHRSFGVIHDACFCANALDEARDRGAGLLRREWRLHMVAPDPL